jgi:hypothetical protein
VCSSDLVGTCSSSTNPLTTVLTTFAGIPPTAFEVFGSIYPGGYAAVSNVGTSTPQSNSIAAGGVVTSQFDLILPAAQVFYICNTVTAGTLISVVGWVDSVNAN